MKEQRGRKPRGTPTEFRLKTPDENGQMICVGDIIYNPDTKEIGMVTSLTKIKLKRGDSKPLENDIYVIKDRAIKKSEVTDGQVKKRVSSEPIFTGLVDLSGKQIYAGDAVFLPADNLTGWVNRYGILIDTHGLNVPLKGKCFISIEHISPEFLSDFLISKGVIV